MGRELGPPGALSPGQWDATVNYDTWTDTYTPDDAIAIHHGGGANYPAGLPPYSKTAEAAQLRSWEAYHLSKGWRGLAYGWAIGQTGTIYRARGWNYYGAHLDDVDGDGVSNNSEIIPVLFIMDSEHQKPSERALGAFAELRAWLEESLARPLYLYGHQEVQTEHPTTCPGKNLMTYVRAHRESEPEPDEPEPPPDDWTEEIIMALPRLTKGDGIAPKTHRRPDVRRAQSLLAAAGTPPADSFTGNHRPDGKFGPATESAVKAFQKAKGIRATGNVGRNTWRKLLGE